MLRKSHGLKKVHFFVAIRKTHDWLWETCAGEPFKMVPFSNDVSKINDKNKSLFNEIENSEYLVNFVEKYRIVNINQPILKNEPQIKTMWLLKVMIKKSSYRLLVD